MVDGMGTAHTRFQQIPTFHRPLLTLTLRDRAQELAQLPGDDWNIIQLTSEDNFVKYGLYPKYFIPKPLKGRKRKFGTGRTEGVDKENELIQLKREAKLKGGASAKQYAHEPLNPEDEAEEEQVTPLKKRKKLPAQPRPIEHAIRIREPSSPARPPSPVLGKGKAVMAEIRGLSDMSQKMLEALKKRVGGCSSASPRTKKSRDGEMTPTKEKAPAGEVINLFEELTAANPSTPKVSKSKDSRGGSSDRPEQPKGGSELIKGGSE
ncbi:uncharacterized protein LOC115715235 [Cannabis sativa]|uniref:uncharacterized protein LOC115715235 n=1 Tax=Cannabis sativa TaxID=3483 RepID=UPI0029C9FA07|nr:uncharacterized protein LOC115715235 [Cannabis sativa]